MSGIWTHIWFNPNQDKNPKLLFSSALEDNKHYLTLLEKTWERIKNITFEKYSVVPEVWKVHVAHPLCPEKKSAWGTNGCRWSTHWYISSAIPPRAIDQWKRRCRQQLCSWVSRAALVCRNIDLKQVTRESDEKHDMNDVSGKNMNEMEWKTHDCIQACGNMESPSFIRGTFISRSLFSKIGFKCWAIWI